jgi:multidrug efflux pump subunit AcrA (membrane-fusion protein)
MQNLTNRTKQTLPSTLILSAATERQAQLHFFGTPEEWNAEWSELTHELTQFEHYAQTQKAQRGFRAWLAEAKANKALEDASITAQIAALQAQFDELDAQK